VTSPLPPDADFAGAAQALVDGCVDLPGDEDRVELLDRICTGLGDELYPGFVQLLWMVGRYGDHHARDIVARTLVHALRTGRLPSGRRAAWGASRGATRSLGPLEYLATWYGGQEGGVPLSAEQFQSGAVALMELIGASDEARLLYCEKLLADADDPLGGVFSRATRAAVRALAEGWRQGAAPDDASLRFLRALDAESVAAGSASQLSGWSRPPGG